MSARGRLGNLLGIDYPIFAFSHCRDVVAAVTNAGGLGVLGAVAHRPEGLDRDLAWIDDHVHGRPYGVDLLLPHLGPETPASTSGPVAVDPVSIDPASIDWASDDPIPARHRAFVDDLLDRYGVAPLLGDEGPARTGRLSVSDEDNSTLLDVTLQHRVALLASALGPPPPRFVRLAHEHGAVVVALAGTVEHARRNLAAGADIVVAQGTEAGGHTGEIASMVLIPQVVDAVGAEVPVVGAGGIASGRQMAAALALGAEGVWCGSVWLTTDEAETHPTVKAKFLAAGSGDTVRSRGLTGKPARQLRTAWTDEWADPDHPAPLPMPLQSVLVAEAQQRIARQAHVTGSGAEALATYFVGQVVGQLDQVRSARSVVAAMVQEFVDTVGHLGDLVRVDVPEEGRLASPG